MKQLLTGILFLFFICTDLFAQISDDKKAPVYSMTSGKVKGLIFDRMIIIEYKGIEISYRDLDINNIKIGDTVIAGQLLGTRKKADFLHNYFNGIIIKIKYKSFYFDIGYMFNVISCQRNNYEFIYNQKLLSISDCKNIELAKWILFNETGIEIDQEIQMIITDYNGGIPLQIENLPIYYKVKINEEQYEEYKKILLSGKYSDNWRFYKENDYLSFVRVNKFELSCKITKNMIIFGFRNVEGITP
jgi:hypothetical protein